MPQIDISGSDSKLSCDKIQGQSGTTVTVPTGHTVAITDSGGLTLAGTAVNAGALGMYASIAIIADQKAYNVHGGSFTSGAWRTRDLNTEISDADGIVSIASNQFTLQAGTYTIEWSAPAMMTYGSMSRLYNVTGSAVVTEGSVEHTAGTDTTLTQSLGKGVVTISGSTVFEIQHRASTTRNTYGLGHRNDFDSASTSTYTIVKILKHS